MPATLPLYDQLSQQSTFEREYLTKSTQYEDQYGEFMPASTNPYVWSVNAVYEGVDATKLTTILTATDSVGGWGTLTYDPVDRAGQSNPIKFRITSKVSITWNAAAIATVSFTLRSSPV